MSLFSRLVEEMGYKKNVEMQSAAVSALTLASSRPQSSETPQPVEVILIIVSSYRIHLHLMFNGQHLVYTPGLCFSIVFIIIVIIVVYYCCCYYFIGGRDDPSRRAGPDVIATC